MYPRLELLAQQELWQFFAPCVPEEQDILQLVGESQHLHRPTPSQSNPRQQHLLWTEHVAANLLPFYANLVNLLATIHQCGRMQLRAMFDTGLLNQKMRLLSSV